MTQGFAAQAYAMQFRDTIAAIVRDELNRSRPQSRYATVVDFDRAANICRVIFSSEVEPVTVRMGQTVQPTEPGDVVRIDGQAGNLYISEVTSGELYQRNEYNRLQFAMQGGGIIMWDGVTFGWTTRFLVIGASQTYEIPKGYFNIEQPAPGQVINWYGTTINSPIVVTAAGITMPGYGALYYEHIQGSDDTSVDTQFRMVDYTGPFEVPANWILVASVSADAASPSLRLGTGEMLDHWRAPTLAGAWVNYGAPFAVAGYRLTANRTVQLKGLVKTGGTGGGNPIFTLPNGYRPGETHLFNGIASLNTETTGAATAGTAHTHPVPVDDYACRIDITSAGLVYVANSTVTTGYVSLSGIQFPAAL